MVSVVPPIPEHHFEALAGLDAEYWWAAGRIGWIAESIQEWLQGQTPAQYAYADLGSGMGNFAAHLQHRFQFKHAWAMEKHPFALKQLRQVPGVTALEGDLETDFHLPAPVDVVTALDVIEHIQDDRACLQRIARCLAPKGLLLLTVPAHPFLYSAWDRQLGHFRRYQASGLRALAEAAGLKVRRLSYFWSCAAPLLISRKWRPAFLTLEWPQTPAWLNVSLRAFARAERSLSRVVPIPFGSSLFLCAEKQ